MLGVAGQIPGKPCTLGSTPVGEAELSLGGGLDVMWPQEGIILSPGEL